MTMTIENAYQILGINSNADYPEAKRACDSLMIKYKNAYEAGDESAYEKMKDVFDAWVLLEKAGFAKKTYTACESVATGEIYDFSARWKTILRLIVSFLLLGGAIYGLAALIRYVSGDIGFFDYFGKGISNLNNYFDFQCTSIMDELTGAFGDTDTQYSADSCYVVMGKVAGSMTTASCLTIITMLFFSCVLYLSFLIYTARINKICMNSEEEDKIKLLDSEYKANLIFKVINISYAVLSYISILLVLSTSWLTTFLLPTFLFTEPVFSIPFILISLTAFYKVGRKYIIKKLVRIKQRRSYDYFENLGTYLMGVAISLVPFIVTAFLAWLVVLILALFILHKVLREHDYSL